MTKISTSLQGLNNYDNHLDVIKSIIEMNDAKKVILSTAFINEKGVSLLEESINKFNKKITVFVGARNGVTTFQGISKLLDLNVEIYLIDTGLNHRIHHQKLYIAYNQDKYILNCGSANLTTGGLLNNIEVSVTVEGKLPDDNIDSLLETFNTLNSNYPKNIINIKSHEDIRTAFKNGQLEDESIKREIIKGTASSTKNNSLIPKMNLPKFDTAKKYTLKSKQNKLKSDNTSITNKNTIILSHDTIITKEIWHSKPLTPRDLNIKVNNANTNSTGSMLLKKGQYDIDQRRYFRHEAFRSLTWTKRVDKEYFEDAEAKFFILIEGIDYGSVILRLKHDARTDTKTYLQKQGMTHLHWGDAKPLISKPQLLGKEMKIFSVSGKNDEFLIEIKDLF